MIIHLKSSVGEAKALDLAQELEAIHLFNGSFSTLVTPNAYRKLAPQYEPFVDAFFPMDSDMQLSNRTYLDRTRTVNWGTKTIGGDSQNCVVIAGPCSIESQEQITQSAELLLSLGIGTLRAGCYKPRTSPYSFQGLGLEGLKMLAKVREKYGLNIITEVKDSTHVQDVIDYTDIVQVGAKAMYDQSILKACGKARKPILIKRGFGSTLQEFVQASEFVLSGGNEQVVLCERGIRTFETKTRFTLDLCGAAYLKHYTNLPVVLDPSHAMGYAYGVPDLSKACMAMGVEGLLIEVHPNPKVAKSDASQQLNHSEFTELFGQLQQVAKAVGRQVI